MKREHPMTRAHEADTRTREAGSSVAAPNLNPAYPGICTGTTLSGAPCGRRMVCANGRCMAHGGAPTPESTAEIQRRYAERLEFHRMRLELRERRQARRDRKAERERHGPGKLWLVRRRNE